GRGPCTYRECERFKAGLGQHRGWLADWISAEKLENDWVAVFLPQAPTPMSGNIMYLPINRVRPLGITMIQGMSIVKAIGVGSGAALRGIDLRLPTADP